MSLSCTMAESLVYGFCQLYSRGMGDDSNASGIFG